MGFDKRGNKEPLESEKIVNSGDLVQTDKRKDKGRKQRDKPASGHYSGQGVMRTSYFQPPYVLFFSSLG